MEFLQMLDQSAWKWVQQFWGSPLDRFWLDVSALGGQYILTLVVLFSIGMLLCVHRYRTAGFVLAAALGGALMMRALKDLFDRVRPPLHHPLTSELSPSFPSGHSMLSAVIYLTMALLVTALLQRRRLRIYIITCSLLLAGLIGLSRIYLGVHYVTDVLAGWFGGLAWALLCRWVESHWVLRAERRAAATELLDDLEPGPGDRREQCRASP